MCYEFVQIGNLFFPEWEVTCGDCGSKMSLVSGETLNRTLMYRCANWPTCKGIHSAFPNGKPVGVPADKDTRSLRCVIHRILDPIWKSGTLSRKKLYKRLAKRLGMSECECHVGRFDDQQCRQAIKVARQLQQELQSKAL